MTILLHLVNNQEFENSTFVEEKGGGGVNSIAINLRRGRIGEEKSKAEAERNKRASRGRKKTIVSLLINFPVGSLVPSFDYTSLSPSTLLPFSLFSRRVRFTPDYLFSRRPLSGCRATELIERNRARPRPPP